MASGCTTHQASINASPGSHRKRQQTKRKPEERMMKSLVSSLTSVVVIFLLANAALGQNGAVLKADIPFSFAVADRTLPAGQYLVSNLGEKTLRIVNSNNNQGAFVLTYMADGDLGAGA